MHMHHIHKSMKIDSFGQMLMLYGRSIQLQLLILTSDTSLLPDIGSAGGCDVFIMVFKHGIKKKKKKNQPRMKSC